jgi:hypothetical protein
MRCKAPSERNIYNVSSIGNNYQIDTFSNLKKLRITDIRPVIGFVDRNPKFLQANVHINILDFRLVILDLSFDFAQYDKII